MNKLMRIAVALALFLTGACGSDDSHKEPDVVAVEDTSGEVPDVEKTEDGGARETEAGSTDAAAPEGYPLTIVFINDLHSHLVGFGPEADYTPNSTGDDGTIGGIARMATIVKEIRAEVGEENFLALDAGDFTQGTLFSTIAPTQGAELHLLDMIGFHATVLGNHEFDWGPQAAADIVRAGTKDTAIRIFSSNIVTDDADPKDDDFAALYDEGLLHRELLLELPNGLKVGLFGLLGKGARDDAPFMVPLTISEPEYAADEAMESLEAQGADIVIALSHSGVFEGEEKYEDEKLAELVKGLDVIISGHTHTPLFEPEGDYNTLVVQAGNYGRFVGRMDLLITPDGNELVGYELIPVDDTVPGDPEVHAAALSYIGKIDETLEDLELTYDTVVVQTTFDMDQLVIAESTVGNLLTDAVLAETNKLLVGRGEEPVIAVFEANGVIRDSILTGESHLVQLSDAFRVLPLGVGEDGMAGYPLTLQYLNVNDLKTACEIVLALPDLFGEAGDTYFLQWAGFRFTYDPDKIPMNRVNGIYLKEGDGYAGESIDLDNTETLYRAATNFYVASLIATLKDLSMGMMEVVPKHADGTPVEDFTTTIIDADLDKPGVQEVKTWLQLTHFMMAFPDTDGDNIPDVPEKYATPEGRYAPSE